MDLAFILGYHGCNRRVGERLLAGTAAETRILFGLAPWRRHAFSILT
jgi:hypothetical protein